VAGTVQLALALGGMRCDDAPPINTEEHVMAQAPDTMIRDWFEQLWNQIEAS